MKRSTRLVAALGLAEFGLAGIWYWLIASLNSGQLTAATNPIETITTVSSTIGGVMGLLAGLCGVAWLTMRRRGI